MVRDSEVESEQRQSKCLMLPSYINPCMVCCEEFESPKPEGNDFTDRPNSPSLETTH